MPIPPVVITHRIVLLYLYASCLKVWKNSRCSVYGKFLLAMIEVVQALVLNLTVRLKYLREETARLFLLNISIVVKEQRYCIRAVVCVFFARAWVFLSQTVPYFWTRKDLDKKIPLYRFPKFFPFLNWIRSKTILESVLVCCQKQQTLCLSDRNMPRLKITFIYVNQFFV